MNARRHSWIAWLALVAFLLAALGPPRHLPMGDMARLGGLGDLIVLCTPQGMKLVRLGDEAPVSPEKPAQGRVCPVCIGLNLAGLATLAPPPIVVTPTSVAYAAPILVLLCLAPPLFQQAPQPRGPPSIDPA